MVACSRSATRRFLRIASTAVLTAGFALQFIPSAGARPSVVLEQVSHDPFHNPGYEHRSEVEPDIEAHGRTAVATYQVGRAAEGGSVAIGVATSTDDGRTWSDRLVRGSSAATGGHYQRASDPSVTYGAEGKGWLVGFLGLTLTGRYHDYPRHSAVLVSRSADGRSFSAPVVVARAPSGVVFDKPWVGCDDHPASPYYGRCYALWDEIGLHFGGPADVILAATSQDGGGHWSAPVRTADHAEGFGVVPLVRPDGSVTVVYKDTENPFHPTIAAFATLDGGHTWGNSSTISTLRRSSRELPVRDPGFPSVGIGQRGSMYVAWSDCRFEPSCAVDDIVVSTSSDGERWTPPAPAVRADPTSATSLVTPGIAVDSRGTGSQVAIVFYAVGGTKCTEFSRPSACSVTVGYTSWRRDGWGAPVGLGWRMRPNWFPGTPAGSMWGDYIGAAFLQDGRVTTMLPLANRPGLSLDVAMYAPRGGVRP